MLWYQGLGTSPDMIWFRLGNSSVERSHEMEKGTVDDTSLPICSGGKSGRKGLGLGWVEVELQGSVKVSHPTWPRSMCELSSDKVTQEREREREPKGRNRVT